MMTRAVPKQATVAVGVRVGPVVGAPLGSRDLVLQEAPDEEAPLPSWPPPPLTLTFDYEPRVLWRYVSTLAGYGPPIAYTDVDSMGWE